MQVAKVVILGAGVMGAAMSVPVSINGNDVKLVGTHLEDAVVEALARGECHPGLGLKLPPAVAAHPFCEFERIMASQPDLLILGVSPAGLPWAIDQIARSANSIVPILMLTKGLVAKGDGIEVLSPFFGSRAFGSYRRHVPTNGSCRPLHCERISGKSTYCDSCRRRR